MSYIAIAFYILFTILGIAYSFKNYSDFGLLSIVSAILVALLGIACICFHILLRFKRYKIGAIAIIWIGILFAIPFIIKDTGDVMTVLGLSIVINGIAIYIVLKDNILNNINIKTSKISKAVIFLCGILTLIIFSYVFYLTSHYGMKVWNYGLEFASKIRK